MLHFSSNFTGRKVTFGRRKLANENGVPCGITTVCQVRAVAGMDGREKGANLTKFTLKNAARIHGRSLHLLTYPMTRSSSSLVMIRMNALKGPELKFLFVAVTQMKSSNDGMHLMVLLMGQGLR
jgi:hypothetical protein